MKGNEVELSKLEITDFQNDHTLLELSAEVGQQLNRIQNEVAHRLVKKLEAKMMSFKPTNEDRKVLVDILKEIGNSPFLKQNSSKFSFGTTTDPKEKQSQTKKF